MLHSPVSSAVRSVPQSSLRPICSAIQSGMAVGAGGAPRESTGARGRQWCAQAYAGGREGA
eukprot:5500147-Lingulodinium_polyedra.AAC.1